MSCMKGANIYTWPSLISNQVHPYFPLLSISNKGYIYTFARSAFPIEVHTPPALRFHIESLIFYIRMVDFNNKICLIATSTTRGCNDFTYNCPMHDQCIKIIIFDFYLICYRVSRFAPFL